jgi:hypothetical protein
VDDPNLGILNPLRVIPKDVSGPGFESAGADGHVAGFKMPGTAIEEVNDSA